MAQQKVVVAGASGYLGRHGVSDPLPTRAGSIHLKDFFRELATKGGL